ncbi:MAG: histidine phosphatase family protein [Chloroflexi bacterium]|nr:histidine phosphatase family protein [Chloroflexota bacterium]
MQLYIIRHAQSENNALWTRTRSSNGRSPDPLLTETGQQQAVHLAHYLTSNGEDGEDADVSNKGQLHNRSGYSFTHLYTSFMQRAIATGSPIAEKMSLPLVAWEIIHEFGGIFETDAETDERMGLPGPNRAYFEAHYPQLVLPDSLGDDGWWKRPYEDPEQIMPRAKTFLAELQQRHQPTDRVAIVTHGGFFTAILRNLFSFSTFDKGEEENRIWLHANNTSITRLNLEEAYVELVYLNRIAHLPSGLIT